MESIFDEKHMFQVQEWFKNKLRIQVLDVPSSPSSSEERTAVSAASLSNNALPNTSDMPKGAFTTKIMLFCFSH